MSSRVFIFTFSTRITFLPSARQGNVFTDVCDSIYRGVSPQQTATAADGTHPTGMHSCKVNNFKFKGFQNCSGFTVIIFNFVPASHFFSPEILRQFTLVQQQSFHRSKASSNRGARFLRLHIQASSEPLNRNYILSRKGMRSNRSSGQAEQSASVIRLCREMSLSRTTLVWGR